MHAQELMPRLPRFTAAEGERWVGAALAEASALRLYDGRLYPLTEDPAAAEVTASLHAAWRDWARDAEALLDRLSHNAEGEPSRADELRFAHGYARCLAGLSPEEMRRRHADSRREGAKMYSIREVRRELGLAHRG